MIKIFYKARNYGFFSKYESMKNSNSRGLKHLIEVEPQYYKVWFLYNF